MAWLRRVKLSAESRGADTTDFSRWCFNFSLCSRYDVLQSTGSNSDWAKDTSKLIYHGEKRRQVAALQGVVTFPDAP